MHAYTLNSYGPDGLGLTEIDEPTAGHGEVKVRVEQIGINPLDWKIRNGYLAQMLPLELPDVIGSDIAGTVLAVGDGVVDLAPGDRVVGFADSGAFAAIAVTRWSRLTEVPAGVHLQTAAAVATSAETAQRVLRMIDITPGSAVVVNGAAGSVGSAVSQLLVAAGHTVIGTAGESNHTYVRELGAQPVSYGPTMLNELAAAAPHGIDAAIDTAGRDFIARVRDLIAPNRIVTIVDFAAGAAGAIVAGGDPTQLTADTIGVVLDRVAAGTFRADVVQVFPFEELNQALSVSEAGHLRGKLIVTGAAS